MSEATARRSLMEEGAEGSVSSEIDWMGLVRAYPIPALLLAAVGGYVLGRKRGPEILEAVSDFAAGEVASNVNAFLGEEIIDPTELEPDG